MDSRKVTAPLFTAGLLTPRQSQGIISVKSYAFCNRLYDSHTEEQREEIVGNEYNIPIESSIRRDINIMCNLSQGIREDAIAEAQAEIIMNMYKKGFTLEQIADVTEKSVEEIKAIIEKREPALA